MGKQRGPQSSPPAVTSTPEAMTGAYSRLTYMRDVAIANGNENGWTGNKNRLVSEHSAAIQALEHCSRAHWDTVGEFRLAAHEYAEKGGD